MLFSVVILSYNSERTLDQCLFAVESSLYSFSEKSEVFVIENGSIDGSKAILAKHAEKEPDLYKRLDLSKNFGTTASRNMALRKCSGRYILVLDSDAYISHEVLLELKNYLDRHSHVGLVSPKLRYKDGRFQLSTDQFPTLLRKAQRFLKLGALQSAVDESALRPGPVDYSISACWLMKSEAQSSAGLLDEAIFYSPEDVDYCMQIWKSGFEVHYNPAVEMVHDAQERSRGFKLNKFHFSHLKGLFYLFIKHRYFFSVKHLRNKSSKRV